MDRRLCAEPMPMSSYGTLGFNVGSLVIPHQSILFPGWPILYDWWGGDFHLGAGIIALWASFLLFSPKAIGGPLVRNWPLAVLLFFFALFCVSNHVNFGATTLFTYPLPQFVAPVIGMARRRRSPLLADRLPPDRYTVGTDHSATSETGLDGHRGDRALIDS